MLNRSNFKAALATTPDCLSPEQLENLTGEAVQNHPHVAQCPRCQSELALLRSFESESPLADEGAAVAWISAQMERRLDQIKGASSGAQPEGSWIERWFGTRNVRWLAPVAAAAVVAVAGFVWMHSRNNKEPDLLASAGSGTAIYRSQEIEVVGPAGEVAQAPKSLQWKPFPGAADYKVEVMEVDHASLWTSQTIDNSVTIPASTRAKMLPGKPVLWQVTALSRQGQVLATSQVQRFSVSRKSPRSGD
jgi:hypothetical protein